VASAWDTLVSHIDVPSWREILRTGVFTGLGELGDVRAVPVLCDWLTDLNRPMDARLAAAQGLLALANTRRIDRGEAQSQAVQSLIVALNDPWELTVMSAIRALRAWRDERAILALERLSRSNPDQRVVRVARETLHALRTAQDATSDTQRLRAELEALREDTRRLRERLDTLEERSRSRGLDAQE